MAVSIKHSRMTTIITRYVGPSNVRGARIIADAGDGRRVTVSYDHLLSTDDAHAAAAIALCAKMGWDGELIAGGLSRGHAFIFVDK